METNIRLSREEIIRKMQFLEEVKISLKKVFFGIDDIIDSIIETISPWFITPKLQERPLIINLWGMTGTGKTSLVVKLAELLGMADKLFQYDLSTNNFGIRLFNEMNRLGDRSAGETFIILLDEFQNARTIDNEKNEKEPSEMKAIWSLIDSGKLLYSPLSSKDSRGSICGFRDRIASCITEGITIKDGKFVGNEEIYNVIMSIDGDNSSVFTENNIWLVWQFYPNYGYYELLKMLSSFNETDLLTFLDVLFKKALSQTNIDASKALVFITGNLDEAFNMNSELNPDIDPDTYRESTLKITIPEIKKALQSRFRNEQISRLGNIHYIYPALGSREYKAIIRHKLESISDQFLKETNIRIIFDPSIEVLVFEEGVYPVQGTRPLFSTIYNLVNTKLSKFIVDFYQCDSGEVDSIEVSYKNRIMQGKATYECKIIGIKEYDCSTDLSKLRENKQDDSQAITSVHEAGHTVLSIVLLRRIPELIRSRTAGVNTGGFVSGNIFDDTVVKDEVIKRMAILLGGMTAEQFIFGESLFTSGSASDIRKATNFGLEIAKTSGFASVPVNSKITESNTNFFFHENAEEIEAEVLKWIIDAKELAVSTLKTNETFLMSLSEALFDKSILTKGELEIYTRRFFSDFSEKQLICNGSKGEYVEILQTRARKLKEVSYNRNRIDTGFSDLVAYSE